MADDKQERIETLQDRVDEPEATVSKLLPSRRDALKLGAAGAFGAVGMAGSASAQNSGQTGTIGTDADRVDVNAEDIDAVSVNTEQANVGQVIRFGKDNGNSGQDSFNTGSVTAGNGQSFSTGINANAFGSSIALVSFKSSSARIDTYLFIINRAGAAGFDESYLVDSSDNSAGSSNVSMSTNASDNYQLNADLAGDMQEISVTIIGYGV